jgi:CelD/BcsL family acetyltransferase involved in cellulose biosynthesis
VSERPVIAVEEVEGEADESFSIHSQALAAVREEWIALHASCGAPGPFQRPEWHEAWLRHFGAGVDAVYLAVRRGETLVGMAPLALEPGRARELGEPNIRDYAGPLAAVGFENDVVLALLDWMAEDMTPALDLWGIREGDPMLALFRAEAADNGWDLDVREEAVAPALSLPDTWEDYLAALSKHDRHELRRKLRNLEAHGGVEYTATGDPAEIAAQLPRLFAMMRASHDGKGEFLTAPVEAFFADLATILAPLGLMRLGTLSLDGRPVAMLYTFEDAQGVYLYNSGFEPEHAPLAVGLLSKAYAIRDAIARGKRRFDFLRGNEDYKRRLGGIPRTVYALGFRRR